MHSMNPFLGRWRIEEMECWRREYLDLVVPAFIEFERERGGSFQFGTVVGWLDYRVMRRGETVVAEWSWEGRNDTDSACGRGWAELQGGGLVGHLYIHCSDDSSFRAVRAPVGSGRPVPRPRGRSRARSNPALQRTRFAPLARR